MHLFHPALVHFTIAFIVAGGLAEAYGDGLWEVDDLVALIRIGVLNETAESGLERGTPRLRYFFTITEHFCIH